MENFIKQMFAPVEPFRFAMEENLKAKAGLDQKIKEEIRLLESHVSWKDHDAEVQKIKDKYLNDKTKIKDEYTSLEDQF